MGEVCFSLTDTGQTMIHRQIFLLNLLTEDLRHLECTRIPEKKLFKPPKGKFHHLELGENHWIMILFPNSIPERLGTSLEGDFYS